MLRKKRWYRILKAQIQCNLYLLNPRNFFQMNYQLTTYQNGRIIGIAAVKKSSNNTLDILKVFYQGEE